MKKVTRKHFGLASLMAMSGERRVTHSWMRAPPLMIIQKGQKICFDDAKPFRDRSFGNPLTYRGGICQKTDLSARE